MKPGYDPRLVSIANFAAIEKDVSEELTALHGLHKSLKGTDKSVSEIKESVVLAIHECENYKVSIVNLLRVMLRYTGENFAGTPMPRME